MRLRSVATQEDDSEQQLELGNDVFSHPPSSTFFSKGLCLMLWKNMMVNIGGRPISNLRFFDDIDARDEEEQELENLIESLDKICTMYIMEISSENSANGIQREFKFKRQKLGTMTELKVHVIELIQNSITCTLTSRL